MEGKKNKSKKEVKSDKSKKKWTVNEKEIKRWW
jgi:hypothetical protein